MPASRDTKAATRRTSQKGTATSFRDNLQALRVECNMTQEQLAMLLGVSRQLVTKWEADRTYPDIQSLLLLSEILAATVGFLIEGDVETIRRDVVLIRRLGFARAGLLLSLAATTWLTVRCVVWDGAMFASVWAERIKRDHDLVTYREVVDFWEGGEVDRNTERERRECAAGLDARRAHGRHGPPRGGACPRVAGWGRDASAHFRRQGLFSPSGRLTPAMGWGSIGATRQSTPRRSACLTHRKPALSAPPRSGPSSPASALSEDSPSASSPSGST